MKLCSFEIQFESKAPLPKLESNRHRQHSSQYQTPVLFSPLSLFPPPLELRVSRAVAGIERPERGERNNFSCAHCTLVDRRICPFVGGRAGRPIQEDNLLLSRLFLRHTSPEIVDTRTRVHVYVA